MGQRHPILAPRLARSVFTSGFGTGRAGSADLSVSRNATSVTVGGGAAPAVLPAADATSAGVLSAADKQRLDSLSAVAGPMLSFATAAEVEAGFPTGDYLRTAGRHAAGDGGAALWRRIPAMPDHALVLVSADGAIWELVPEMGRIDVRQAGARGDGITDDAPAIQSALDFAALGAIRAEYATSYTVQVPPTDKFYMCRSTLIVRRTVAFTGEGGTIYGPSMLKFQGPSGEPITGIRVVATHRPVNPEDPPGYAETITDGNGFFGGVYARIERLSIQALPTFPSGQGGNAHGIDINVTCTLRELFVGHFQGDGVLIDANGVADGIEPSPRSVAAPGTRFGNANLCTVEQVRVIQCTGNGFRAIGKDANACVFRDCDTSGNHGVGFLDDSTLGNIYERCHVQGNVWKVGARGDNTRVFAAIAYSAGTPETEPLVGADWEEYWQEIGSDLPEVIWEPGTEYFPSGSYHSANTTAYSTYMGCYSEGGIMGAAVLSNNDVVLGGAMMDNAGGGVLRRSNVRVTAIGGSHSPGHYIATGNDTGDRRGAPNFGCALGPDSVVPKMFEFGHADDPAYTSGFNTVQMVWSNTALGRPLLNPGTPEERPSGAWELNHNGSTVMQITVDGFKLDDFGGQPGLQSASLPFFENGLLLRGKNQKTAFLMGGNTAALPTLGAEVVSRGTYIFLSRETTSGNPVMAKVTVAGSLGSTAVLKFFGTLS